MSIAAPKSYLISINTLNPNNGQIWVPNDKYNYKDTTLALAGIDVPVYAHDVYQNLINLLENFAGSTAPRRQIIGQLWYDVDTKQIKTYGIKGWVPVGSTTVKNFDSGIPFVNENTKINDQGGIELQFKTLLGGNRIDIAQAGCNEIVISCDAISNDGKNVGLGYGYVFKEKVDDVLLFRTLNQGNKNCIIDTDYINQTITISTLAERNRVKTIGCAEIFPYAGYGLPDLTFRSLAEGFRINYNEVCCSVEISTSAENNTGMNIAGSYTLYAGMYDTYMKFRTLRAGKNIIIEEKCDQIKISTNSLHLNVISSNTGFKLFNGQIGKDLVPIRTLHSKGNYLTITPSETCKHTYVVNADFQQFVKDHNLEDLSEIADGYDDVTLYVNSRRDPETKYMYPTYRNTPVTGQTLINGFVGYLYNSDGSVATDVNNNPLAMHKWMPSFLPAGCLRTGTWGEIPVPIDPNGVGSGSGSIIVLSIGPNLPVGNGNTPLNITSSNQFGIANYNINNILQHDQKIKGEIPGLISKITNNTIPNIKYDNNISSELRKISGIIPVSKIYDTIPTDPDIIMYHQANPKVIAWWCWSGNDVLNSYGLSSVMMTAHDSFFTFLNPDPNNDPNADPVTDYTAIVSGQTFEQLDEGVNTDTRLSWAIHPQSNNDIKITAWAVKNTTFEKVLPFYSYCVILGDNGPERLNPYMTEIGKVWFGWNNVTEIYKLEPMIDYPVYVYMSHETNVWWETINPLFETWLIPPNQFVDIVLEEFKNPFFDWTYPLFENYQIPINKIQIQYNEENDIWMNFNYPVQSIDWNNVILLMHMDIYPPIDSSKYNQQIFIPNDTTAPSVISGQYGNGLEFINDQYLSISNSFKFPGAFCIEFWLNIESYPIDDFISTIFDNRSSLTDQDWSIWAYADGTIAMAFGGNNYQSWTAIQENTWNHIAFSRDINNNLMCFINGSLDVKWTNASHSIIGGANTLYFGCSFNFPGQISLWNLNGMIDEVRFTQGQAVYLGNFIPSKLIDESTKGTSAKNSDYIITDFISNTFDTYNYQNPIQSIIPNIISDWNFDPYYVSGNNMADAANLTRIATLNDPYILNTTKSIYQNGFYSNSISGNIGYVEISPTIYSLQNNFSISVWINKTTFTNGSTEYIFNTDFASSSGWAIYTTTTGPYTNINFGFYLTSSPTTLQLLSNLITNSIMNGRWYHVLITIEPTSVKMYINSVLSHQKSGSNFAIEYQNVNNTYIGAYKTDVSSNRFNGYIDEVRTYDTSLTTDQITSIYNYKGTDYVAITDPLYTNYVKLLAHFDGNYNESTGKTITAQKDSFSQYIPTRYGQSVLLNKDNYLKVAYNTDFDLTNKSFCIEFWIRWTDISNYQNIIIQSSTSGNSILYIDKDENNSIIAGIRSLDDINNGMSLTTSFRVSNNTWYHVAFDRKSYNFNIFINGVSYTNAISNISKLTTSSDLYIGKHPYTTSILNAYIDELRITVGSNRYSSNFTQLQHNPYPETQCSLPPFNFIPDPFTFNDITDTIKNAYIISNTVTLAGFSTIGIPVNVVGDGDPQLTIVDISGSEGLWTNYQTIYPWQKLKILLKSSPDGNVTYTATITAGDYVTQWKVTTKI